MKHISTFLAALICLILASAMAWAQLNGTKHIDASGGGDYLTFAAAIGDLNTNGTTTGVTFLIASGTYTENQIAINIGSNPPSASAQVVFKPAPGATVVWNIGGQTTTNRFGLRMGDVGGADYVTLDGSNTVGGTTRDWTITASDGTYGLEPIDIFSHNDTLKNCIIACGSGLEGATGGYGITLRDMAPTAANVTIQNNKITSNYAVAVGRAAGGPNVTGCKIQGNELHGWKRGVYVPNSSDLQILDNDIAGDAVASYPTGSTYGIEYGDTASATAYITGNNLHDWGRNDGAVGPYNIYGMNISGGGTFYIGNNKISKVMFGTSARSVSNLSAVGIYMSNALSPTYYVYNNMLYAFDDTSTNNQAGFTAGIRTGSSSTGTLYLYHNSIYMGNVSVRTHSTAAFLISGAVTSTVKNNIAYVNVTGYSSSYKSYAFYKAGTGLATSDYNDFYNDGGGSYSYITTQGTGTFADWQATGQDAHSISMSPANAFGAAGQWNSISDLHWQSKPSDSFAGTPLAPPCDVDIDAQPRSTSFPYMGADEIPGSPLPVELSSFTASSNLQNAILRWTTATETNCFGFDIERKSGFASWTKAGFVQGSGTSTSFHNYSFTDANVTPGTHAYRIKQINKDGSSAYIGTAEVEISSAPRKLTLGDNYPNPFNPSTTLSFTVPQDGRATLRVYNIIGQEVETLYDGVATAGQVHTKVFDASRLSSGLYFSRLDFGGRQLMHKMILIK